MKELLAPLVIWTVLAGAVTIPSAIAGPQDGPQKPSLPDKRPRPTTPGLAKQQVKEGIRLAELGRLSQAADQFVEALQIDPQNVEARYNLGLVQMRWDDTEAAKSSFHEVLRIDPAHDGAQLRLASILTQLARDDQNYIPQAVAAYERAIELDPAQPEIYFNLGYLEIRKSDYLSAAEEYKKTLSLDPRYPGVCRSLGISLYHAHEFEEARAMLQAAVGEEPNSAEAHHYFGLALGKCNQWEAAAGELRVAARLAPDDGEIHYVLAEALRRIGHAEEANAEMAVAQNLQAHSADKTQAHFRDYQARKALEAGEVDSAIDSYRQSLELVKDARTATNMGVALLWKGNPGDAIQALQRALDIDPKFEWAYYYLGVAFAREHEFENSEEALNGALKLRPEFPEAEFYRGLVYASEGRFREAEPVLRAAVRSRPDAAATHYYLGSVLLRLGKNLEGQNELEISRRLDPDFAHDTAIGSLRSNGDLQPAAKTAAPH